MDRADPYGIFHKFNTLTDDEKKRVIEHLPEGQKRQKVASKKKWKRLKTSK